MLTWQDVHESVFLSEVFRQLSDGALGYVIRRQLLNVTQHTHIHLEVWSKL